MTLPVFSETEASHLRATKKICGQCQALGMVVVKVPTSLYACGYYTAAERCPLCQGTGIVEGHIIHDHRRDAAGDRSECQ